MRGLLHESLSDSTTYSLSPVDVTERVRFIHLIYIYVGLRAATIKFELLSYILIETKLFFCVTMVLSTEKNV